MTKRVGRQFFEMCGWGFRAALVVTALLSSGCGFDYGKKMGEVRPIYTSGQLDEAAKQLSQAAGQQKCDKCPKDWDTDALAYLMDAGSLCRAAGDVKTSNKLLAEAIAGMEYFDEEAPDHSVSGEVASVLINQAVAPHRGHVQDRVMAGTYRALNFLQCGEPEKALPSLKYATFAQEDLVRRREDVIAKAQEKLKQREGVNWNLVKEAKANESKSPEWKAANDELANHVPDLSASAAYCNPYTMYLYGLVRLVSNDVQDHEQARKLIESVQGLIGENKFVVQDRAMIAAVQKGTPIPPTTYVFFETGLAPRRRQVAINMPIYVRDPRNGGTLSPGCFPAALPALEFQNDFVDGLTVTTATATETTVRLANIEALIAREFKDDLPLITMKALISGATKVAALASAYQGVVNQQVRGEQGIATELVYVTAVAYAQGTNAADLRTWQTLPKEVQFCHVPTPQDRHLNVIVPTTGQVIPVQIEPGIVNLILVRSINPSTPMRISQVKLK